MLTYIKNVLPRIRKFSNQLDKTENFIGKKWQLLDEASNGHSYEFLRDGRLIMSIVVNKADQETRIGTWELLPSERLLIHRPEPLLLEQAFLGDGLLIFQVSGTNKNPFSLYDPKVITDGNIEVYLEKFLKVKEAAQIMGSEEFDKDGRRKYRNPDGSLYNGRLQDPVNVHLTRIIENGSESRHFYTANFKSVQGWISILRNHTEYNFLPAIGDEVRKDELIAPDGIYVLSSGEFNITNDWGIERMEVVNGKINKISADNSSDSIVAGVCVILAFVIIAIAMFIALH